MPTRSVFDDGPEITGHESDGDVVLAVRRDHPNHVRLRRDGEGRRLYVKWDRVRRIEPHGRSG